MLVQILTGSVADRLEFYVLLRLLLVLLSMLYLVWTTRWLESKLLQVDINYLYHSTVAVGYR